MSKLDNDIKFNKRLSIASLVVSMFAVMVSICAIIPSLPGFIDFIKRDHDLKVYVSSFSQKNQQIAFELIFKNSGYYQEAILDVSISLKPVNTNLTISFFFPRSNSSKPIIINSNDITSSEVSVDVPAGVYDFIKPSSSSLIYEAKLLIKYIDAKGRINYEEFDIGKISQYISNGTSWYKSPSEQTIYTVGINKEELEAHYTLPLFIGTTP